MSSATDSVGAKLLLFVLLAVRHVRVVLASQHASPLPRDAPGHEVHAEKGEGRPRRWNVEGALTLHAS
jgi:hypothetical protein